MPGASAWPSPNGLGFPKRCVSRRSKTPCIGCGPRPGWPSSHRPWPRLNRANWRAPTPMPDVKSWPNSTPNGESPRPTFWRCMPLPQTRGGQPGGRFGAVNCSSFPATHRLACGSPSTPWHGRRRPPIRTCRRSPGALPSRRPHGPLPEGYRRRPSSVWTKRRRLLCAWSCATGTCTCSFLPSPNWSTGSPSSQ